MFDHIELKVSSLERSKAFYREALAPVGGLLILDTADLAGFSTGRIVGADHMPRVELLLEAGAPLSPCIHLAFSATTRSEVDEFYRQALAAGGKPNGEPGIRSDYHAAYYGAFVLDPDGHNIEAVCHSNAFKED